MKKLIAIALVSLTATGAFAKNQSFNVKALGSKSNVSLTTKTQSTMNWYLQSPSDTVTITNVSTYPVYVFIGTDKYPMGGSGQPYDTTHILCGDKSITLQPGSSVVCDIQPNNQAAIQVSEGIFKIGAAGIYSVT